MIVTYQELWQEIMKLDSIQHSDLIYLDCQHLKNSLANSAYQLGQMLLDKVALDHRKENQRSVLFLILYAHLEHVIVLCYGTVRVSLHLSSLLFSRG